MIATRPTVGCVGNAIGSQNVVDEY